MLSLTFYAKHTYTTQSSVDEILARINTVILNTPNKNIFNATTDDDMFLGYLSGLKFSIEPTSFTNRRTMNVIADGTFQPFNNTLAVTYKPNAEFLITLSILLFAVSLICVLDIGKNARYTSIWIPAVCYIAAILLFNYQVAVISDFLERICEAPKSPTDSK
ncbi:hypothetical protein GCM10028809_04810 [Spirosoma gilvum]